MQLSFHKTSCGKHGKLLALALAVSLSACASTAPVKAGSAATGADGSGAQVIAPTGIAKFFNYISPYKITIQQGNFVSQEMVDQLKEGMTREQVRFLLGTALLTDMFHEDRWDYPFRLLKPNGELITSRVTVFFKSNTVTRFEGGNLPTEKAYLAQITESAITSRVETSELTEAPKKK